jgi:hypothetical protein
MVSGPLLMRGGRGNTGQTPHPISARARGHFRIPTRFPPCRRHSHPRAAAGNRIFRRILFYGVGIQGLLARTSFRPVESEYRALYSRFTGQKNRGSVRHALTWQGTSIPYGWTPQDSSSFTIPGPLRARLEQWVDFRPVEISPSRAVFSAWPGQVREIFLSFWLKYDVPSRP